MLKCLTLEETVPLMLSDDYKDRFTAEVDQLAIRIHKLQDMLEAYKAGTLNFKPTCGIDLLQRQLDVMLELYDVLAYRALKEDIIPGRDRMYNV